MLKKKLILEKLFMLVELQLNVILVQSILVITKSIANQLLFYNCVRINSKLIINPYYICTLFDIIIIPQYIFLISNLQTLQRTRLFNFKIWPLIYYIISWKIGLILVVAYPTLFLNTILIKIKFKYKLFISNIFAKKINRTIGFNAILRTHFLQYLQLFKQ